MGCPTQQQAKWEMRQSKSDADKMGLGRACMKGNAGPNTVARFNAPRMTFRDWTVHCACQCTWWTCHPYLYMPCLEGSCFLGGIRNNGIPMKNACDDEGNTMTGQAKRNASTGTKTDALSNMTFCDGSCGGKHDLCCFITIQMLAARKNSFGGI